MFRYRYIVEGRGAGGHTWSTAGEIVTAEPGTFPAVVQTALRESFEQLTSGKARYGDPRTCRGPYLIDKLTVEVVQPATADLLAEGRSH